MATVARPPQRQVIYERQRPSFMQELGQGLEQFGTAMGALADMKLKKDQLELSKKALEIEKAYNEEELERRKKRDASLSADARAKNDLELQRIEVERQRVEALARQNFVASSMSAFEAFHRRQQEARKNAQTYANFLNKAANESADILDPKQYASIKNLAFANAAYGSGAVGNKTVQEIYNEGGSLFTDSRLIQRQREEYADKTTKILSGLRFPDTREGRDAELKRNAMIAQLRSVTGPDGNKVPVEQFRRLRQRAENFLQYDQLSRTKIKIPGGKNTSLAALTKDQWLKLYQGLQDGTVPSERREDLITVGRYKGWITNEDEQRTSNLGRTSLDLGRWLGR